MVSSQNSAAVRGEADPELGGSHPRGPQIRPVAEARDDRLVVGLLGALGRGLLVRQGEHVARLRELGEEELQQPEVAVLRRAAHGVAQPLGKSPAARCRDGVVAPPPAGLLARLLEQAGLGEASGLGVELGVGEGQKFPTLSWTKRLRS